MKTILLVDDEIALLNSMRLILEAEGYKVLIASDGELALECLRKAKPLPDLVISDIMMPKLNGVELVLAMKGLPELENIPVIMASSATMLAYTIKGKWNQFLQKPVSEAVLLAAVIKEIGPGTKT